MASGIMRKVTVFLGLDDEEMDDYDPYDDAPVAAHPPTRRYAPEPVEPVANERPLDGIRPIPRAAVQDPSGSVRVTPNPSPVRQITPSVTPRVQIVVPDRFADAQEIGEHCKDRLPVAVNLREADAQLRRRMVDFISGVTYALGGRMEKVADQVFLLTPESFEISADDRRRLQEKGLYNQ